MSGTKGHSGRRRRATAQRNGRVYVALDKVAQIHVDKYYFDAYDGKFVIRWFDEGMYKERRYTDYAAAAAEFVRRVNG